MARFTEWSSELEAELAKPFAKELHTNKGNKGTFVSIHHYVDRLNDLVGVRGWSMPQPMSYHAGNKMGLAVGVTILGVTKWNVGDEMEDHGEPDDDGKVRDFGSSSTNSFAQAFKRCCAYGFGLGLYLYDKEFTRKLLAGQVSAPKASAKPDAPSTLEQQQEIVQLAADRDVPKAKAGGLSRKMNEGMTHDEAQTTITWLRTLPELAKV